MTNRSLRAAWMGLLLVALMVPLPASDAQTSVYPNLIITDLKILDQYDTPQWIDGQVAPTSVEIQATVENNGGTPSSGYRINYYWVDDSGTHWLNGEQTNSFDVSEQTIDPNDDPYKQPPMDWTVQPDQKGSGALRAVLQPSGYDRYTNDNTFTLPLDLDVHDIQVFIADPAQELHNPEETRFVRVSVHNAGTVPETVGLDIVAEQVQPTDRHRDVTPYLQHTTLDVAPGETKESTLFVDYDFRFSSDPGEFTATYVVEATAYDRTQQATTPVFTGIGGNDPPPAGSPVELDRTDGEPFTVPLSGNVTRGFSITNTGTVRDSYRVTPDTDPGWLGTVGLEGLADAPFVRIALEPGETQDFRMTLHAPNDAVAGQPTTAGVKVESDHGASDLGEVWPYRVAGPAIRIEALPAWDLEPYQGDPVHAWVRVHNDGTDSTPLGSALHLVASDGEELDITQELDENFMIPADGFADLLVSSGDNFTGAGETTFTIDWLESGPPIHVEPLEVDGFIHVPDAVITSADGLTGAPGETVRYRTGDHAFVVQNAGNARETFNVQALTDGGVAQRVTDGPVTLDPGQQRTIPVDHVLPLPTGPTKHINVSLLVSVDGRSDLNWTSNTTTGILDQSPPVIDPDGLPYEWALDGNLSIQVVVTDDSSVQWVNVTHTAPDGTQTVHPLALDQDEDADEDEWIADIVLDAVGDHGFSLRATDLHGNNATLDLGKVKVWPIPVPELALVGPQEGAVASPNSTYQVNVSDERPISLVTVGFVNEDGTTTWEADLDLTQDPLTFNLSKAPNGPLKITVQAFNDAGAKATATRNVTMEGQPEETVTTDDAGGPVDEKPTPFPSLAGVLAALAALARRMGARATSSRADAIGVSATDSIHRQGTDHPSHQTPESPLATHSMHTAHGSPKEVNHDE